MKVIFDPTPFGIRTNLKRGILKMWDEITVTLSPASSAVSVELNRKQTPHEAPLRPCTGASQAAARLR